ncbi:MAG: polyprenyl synthetase family protein [Thermoplasmata archaeon]
MMNQYFEEYPKEVEKVLSNFFKMKKDNCKNEKIRDVIEKIEEYTLRGGKRIRPVLMIFGYKLYGGKNTEEIIKASASLELVQSYLLIHDDIIDESLLRRGKPTIHLIFGKEYDDQKIGSDLAIIAGDLADSYAIELITHSDFEDRLKYKAIVKLSEIIEYTGYGQVLDILSPYQTDNFEENLLLIHKYKTAKYTIEGPLILGGLLTGKNDFEMISKYAIAVGIAFQLQDDILGLFGDEKALGKPVTSDLEEGKKTLLIIKILERANKDEKEKILNILGSKNISVEELEYVRNMALKTGSLKYSQDMSEKLIAEAITAIKDLKAPEKEFLIEFANYVISRKF